MPSETWHQLGLRCPACAKNVPVVTVALSVLGNMYQAGYCIPCGHEVSGIINVFTAILGLPEKLGTVQ